MSTSSAIFNSEADDRGFGSFEELSAAGGIRAFYGPESSEVLSSYGDRDEFSSTNISITTTGTIQEGSLSSPQSRNAIPRHRTVDTLEFLEFISKNQVRIIPYDELEVDPADGGTDAFASDATLLQGANMKIIRGKWRTDENPVQRHMANDGCIAVALKVFKKAPVPAVADAAGIRSALDGVRAREAVAAYTRLMRDIFYEIQIMHQAGANQHEHLAELYGLSFEGGASTAGGGDGGDFSVERYLRPILVSPLAHTDYPDLRHFLAHKGASRPRPLPWSLASKLIGDIGEGLHALHHINVVHADLKPENILIYPADNFGDANSSSPEPLRIQARVADFGFSGFKNVREMAPRGGTRVWNAPECLYGWNDVYSRCKRSASTQEDPTSVLNLESAEWGTKVTRDIYSFGLIMVHILLDGAEPLPFGDLAELDRIKLTDEARDVASKKLRNMYADKLSRSEEDVSYEDGAEVDDAILDRLLSLVDQTLDSLPWTRRQSLNAIRSYLTGKFIYDRNLDMMRMVTSNRFPTLASAKFSDLFHQSAASTPAIQLAFRNLPRAIKQSIFQHYIAMGLDNLTYIQSMQLQGLCTQEIRDTIYPPSHTDTSVPVPEPSGPAQPTRVAGPLLKILQGLEEELLDKYYALRDGEAKLRKILLQFASFDPDVGIALDKDVPNQLGLTALHISAMKGDLKSMMSLLDGGAQHSPKSKATLGYITPLELAVSWCPEGTAVPIVQALLASVNGAEAYQARLISRIGCKTTLLHMAAARRSSAILLSLLSGYEFGPEVLNVRDSYYRTPLHIAAQHGCFDSVKLLIHKGANLRAQDYHGLTPHGLAMARLSRREREINSRPLHVGSDMLYDVLTYREKLDPSPADHEAIIHELISRTAESSVPTRALFQFPFQLKHYQAPVRAQPQDTPAFASPKDWKRMADYFRPVGPELQQPTGATGTQGRKYAYSDTGTSIPREHEKVYLSDSLPAKNDRHTGYLLLPPRYGLRFIYHTISDLEPESYQIVLRLGRISHGWNNFPMLLEVKAMPTNEILVLQVWQTADCLPLEDHIYTIKLAEFALIDTTNIEISLSTIDIGSKSNPSAFLALNWLSVEPALSHIPNYAILTATDATVELPMEHRVHHTRLHNTINEYRVLDEVNFEDLQETKYNTIYKEGREFYDVDLHNWDKRGQWRVKAKGEESTVTGMKIGLGNEIIPNFDWTKMIG